MRSSYREVAGLKDVGITEQHGNQKAILTGLSIFVFHIIVCSACVLGGTARWSVSCIAQANGSATVYTPTKYMVSSSLNL